MPYIIAEPCINVKDRSCVDVCPVDCIYDGEDQLYIHPDECIDCGACEPECPVTAIFPEQDPPPQWKAYIAKNRDVFQSAARARRVSSSAETARACRSSSSGLWPTSSSVSHTSVRPASANHNRPRQPSISRWSRSMTRHLSAPTYT